MTRGEDSDEERHDRFRSERNSATVKTSSGGSGLKRTSTAYIQDDRRIRDRRRSRDREHSKSRRSRDRSLERRSRDRSSERRRRSVESRSHKRKSETRDKEEEKKKKKHKGKRSSSDERSKNHRSSRDRSSSERMSGSFSSHDGGKEGSSKRSRKSIETPNDTSNRLVDTFTQRFGRRRDSSVEEEVVVDNNVIYRDSSTSPERSKHKKRKNGEKAKKKEKRREKKKKKNKLPSVSLDVVEPKESEPSEMPGYSMARMPHDNEETPISDVYGPKMPPTKPESNFIGPVVPSSSPEELLPGNRSSLPESSSQPEPEMDFYGPVVPTECSRIAADTDHQEDKTTKDSAPEPSTASPDEGAMVESERVYGPVLPQRTPVTDVKEDDSSYGPALPPRLLKPQPQPLPAESDDSEDGGYGPQLAGVGGRTQEELEIRAALIKRQLGNKEEIGGPKKREEWMIELPESRRADLGLGPRKFRARAAPDMSDRSSWTDTPEEKKKKEELSKLGVDVADDDDDNTNSRLLGIIERDKEMEKKAREVKKKEKSLLHIHQKELKKKKKKEEKERGGKKEERRPFSREVDLQTNRFDEAQKKSIIKKAQLLDSRFSKGESKYL